MRSGRLKATVVAVALAAIPGAIQVVPDGRWLDRAAMEAAPGAPPAERRSPPGTAGASEPRIIAAPPVAAAPPPAAPVDEVPIVPPVELSGPVAEPAAPATTFAPASVGTSDDGVYALVVGIDDYPGSASDLRFAVADANAIDAALAGFDVPRGNRVVLRDSQATHRQLVASVRALVARAGPASTMVLAYAGHVRKLDDDTEAIITADGALLTDEDLAALLAPTVADKVWLLLATCYAGGFTEALAPGRVLTGAAGANQLAYESSSHGASYLVHHMIREGWLQGRAGPTVQQAFAYADSQLAASLPGSAAGAARPGGHGAVRRAQLATLVGAHAALRAAIATPFGGGAGAALRARRAALLAPLTQRRAWRRGWDSNPRRVAPHTLSKRADSAALAPLQGSTRGWQPGPMRLSCRSARSRMWRSGPVQSQSVNRVRAGRQQLSAEPAVCRRSPDRHMGERARRCARPDR